AAGDGLRAGAGLRPADGMRLCRHQHVDRHSLCAGRSAHPCAVMASDIVSLGFADRAGHAAHVLARNPASAAAFVFIPVLALLAALAPWIVPYDPNATDLDHVLQGPAALHWFGTDQVGRDVLSRVLIASRLDLAIAFSAGTIVGGAAAFFGGATDRLVGRATDVLMTFPLFVVAMAMVAALGNSIQSIVVASAVVNLPFFVRLARSEVSVLRSQQFVEAARAGGNSNLQILFGFMIPN